MRRLLFGVLVFAISAGAEPVDEESVLQPDGKAAEYYEILLKRPRPGYLFERFYTSWMEQHDLSDLEPFLKNNDSDESVLLLAFYHEMQREPVQAAELYARLLEARPDWVEVLYYKAQADAERGGYAESAEGLEKLLALEPGEKMQLKALTLLGRTLLRAGKREEGVAAWKRLLEASGMDLDVAEELIELQMVEGLYEEALELCDRLLETSADKFRMVVLRMRRAAVLVRLDRRSDAVDGLREAFDYTGQGSWLQRDVLARIEQLFRGADDMAGLCSLYESMLEEAAGDPALLRAQADALAAYGEDEKALEAARELVRMMPDQREVKEWYIGMLLDQRRTEEAIALLEDFLKRFPADNALRMRLAAVHHQAEEDEKATEWVRAFVEYSNQEVPDYLQAARTLARYGLDNEATTLYLDLLNAYPTSLEGREAIARHLSSMGLTALAWKHYEKLGETCDLDTLLRLTSSLLAVRDANGAYTLLENRKADFDGDFRFVTAGFNAAGALDKTEESLEYGLMRIDLAQTLHEREVAVSALVYWIKRHELSDEWVGKLSQETDLNVGRIWLLVSLHWQQKNRDEASRVLTAALERSPDDAEALKECQLLLAKRARDWATAETVLLELLEKNPETRTARIRDLVQVLQRGGKHDAALEWIEIWKKASPHAIRPYEMERDVLVASNQREEAIQSMRRAVVRFDESKELRASLGSLYEQSGRWQEAEQLYWRTLNAEETLDGRLSHLAHIIRVNQRHNKMDVLIEELERRAENSKKSAFPLLGLAECYRINHRAADRAAVLNRVLELRPNDVAVLRAKAKLEEELGNYDTARELMMRVADSDPSGRAFRKVVEFELLYGEPRRASEMMADPRVAEDADGFIALMEMLVKKGYWEPLEEPLRKRAAMETGDYRFAYLHALVLEETGRPDEAAMAFALLLKVETERPGVKPPSAAAALRNPGVYGIYTDVVSDDVLRIYQTMTGNSKRQAYTYRQNNSYRYYPAGSAPGICPPRLAVLESYVLAHLKEIFSTLSKEAGRALLSETGIEEDLIYARLLLIGTDTPALQPAWWDAALVLYPDSKELRTMQVVSVPQSLETEAAIREAVAGVSEEHPLLAVGILAQGIKRFPALVDLLPEVANRALSRSEDLTQLSYALIQMVHSTPADQSISPELIDVLTATEKRAGELKGVSGDVELALEFAQAITKGDAAAVLAMQKKAFYKQLAGRNTGMMYLGIPGGYYGGIRYGGNIPFEFPPNQLPNVQMDIVKSLGRFSASGALRNVSAAELMEGAEAEDDALFRLLVLAQLDAPKESLADAVQALEKKESPTLDEQLTLACWHNEEHPERSLELLLTARKACKDRIQRNLVEQWMLMAANQLDEIPEALQTELKTEVARMIPSIGTDRTQRIRLMGVMEALDMPIDALLAQSSGGTSRSAYRSSTATRPLDPYQRVRALLDKGETEVAIQRVAIMLRNESLQHIYDQSTTYRNSYQLDNCLSQIKNKNLESLLLGRLRPGSEPSPRQIFEYAFACEKLERNDEAMTGYRKLKELRPDWSGVSVRLCGLLAMEDPAAAQELIATLSVNLVGQMVTQSQNRMNNSSVSYEKRLAYIDLLLGQLEKTPPTDVNVARNTYQALENMLSRNRWYENSRAQLPGMFDPLEAGILAPEWKAPENPSGNLRYLTDETLVDLQQQRRDLYLKLCQHKTKLAGQEEHGFAQRVAYINYTGMESDTQDMLQLAENIIRNKTSRNFYWYSSNDQGRRIQPLEFYLVELHAAGRFDEAENLLEDMEPTNPDHPILKAFLEILAAETDADYLAQVKKVLKTSVHNNEVAVIVLRLPELGGRSVDLEELLWEKMREWNQNNQTHLSTRLMKSWMMLKTENASPEELVDFLEQYLDELFTDAEDRIIAKAAEGSITHQNHQAIYRKYSTVQQMLSGVDLPVEALPALLDKLAYYDRRIQHSGVARVLVQRYLNKEIDYAWLEQMGFLGEWETFNPYSLPGHSQSLFTQVLNKLNGSKGTPVLEKINAQEQQTFGSGLVKTVLKENNSNERPARVLVYFSEHADEMATDPQQQDKLFEWLHSYGNRRGIDKSPDESEATQEMFARYSEWKNRCGLERVEQLENLKMGAASQNWYQWQQKWREATQLILASDPERAFELFEHMARLGKQVTLLQGQTYNERSTLQQLFQSPKGSRQELEFAQRIVDDSGSESAQEWYKQFVSQWIYQGFNRTEQERRKLGDDYNEARLYAGQECLREVLNSDGAASIAAVQNGINRVGSNGFPKLAEWLSEQDLPDSDLKRLTGIYLQSTPEDGPWLETFFADETRSAKERLEAYNWLMNRGDKKPEILDSPELLLGLVDLLSEDGQAKLSGAAYHALIKHTMKMEPSEEKEALTQNVLRLWHANRVSTSRTDQTTLFMLSELAASAGKTEEVIAFLSTGDLPLYPQTYAVALREGLDDFVRKHLPKNILLLRNSYSTSKVWLSPEALEHGQSIAEGVEEAELRLVIQLFLARLPVKDGGQAKQDKGGLNAALILAEQRLTRTELMRWVVITFNTAEQRKRIEDLSLRYAQQADVIDVLRENNSVEMEAYIVYLQGLADAGNGTRLEELLERVNQKATRNLVRNSTQKKGLNALFRCAYTEQALKEKTLDVAVKIEKLRNPNSGRADVLIQMGIISFDLSKMGWDKLSPVKRLEAFQRYDDKMAVGISERLQARWTQLQKEGLDADAARHLARTELIDDWIEEAGTDGFLPLYKSIHDFLGLHYITVEEKESLLRYIHSREIDSLMLDQIRAASSLFLMNRYSKNVPDRRAEDIGRYLARPELDDAEKIRFLTYAKSEQLAGLLQTPSARKGILDAVDREDALLDKYGSSILEVYPLPANEGELAIYNKMADRLMDGLSSQIAAASVVRILLSTDREAEAIKLLNAQSKELLHPAPFLAALENGALEWCSTQLAAWNQLSLAERMKNRSTFDAGMAILATKQVLDRRRELRSSGMVWMEAHAQATVEWLDRWSGKAESIGYCPLHQTYAGLFAKVPDDTHAREMVEQYVQSLESGGQVAGSIRAAYSMAQLKEEQPRLVGMDELGWLDFLAANRQKDPGVGVGFPGHKEALKALQHNRELEKEYGPHVLRFYPLPANEEEAPLYHRMADQIMKNLAGKNAAQKNNDPYRDQLAVFLRTLFALGRTEDALKILDDDMLNFHWRVDAFAVALQNNETDWCTRNLVELLCWKEPVPAGNLGDLSGAREGLPPLLEKIDNPDRKLVAEIFFEAAFSNGKGSPELKQLASRFETHTFSNTTYAVQAREILEQVDAVEVVVMDPAAKAWADEGGVDNLITDLQGMYPARWRVLKRYVNGLLDEGEFGEAADIYEKMAKLPLGAQDALWVAEIATAVDAECCKELAQGKPVTLPGRFVQIDMEARYRLQQAVDALCKKNKTQQSNMNSHLNFAIYALSGHREEMGSLHNVQVNSLEVLFPCFTLFSGVQDGDPDEAKMKRAIVEFSEAIKHHKQNKSSGYIGRFDWNDIAATILKTYPYSLDVEKWKPIVSELEPPRLQPVQFPAGKRKE